MNALRAPALVLVAAAAFALPAVWAAARIDSPLAEDRSVPPILIRPSTATWLDERPATIELEVGEVPTAQTLVGIGGVVTALRAEPGDVFTSGRAILDLNDRPVYALVSPAPLYRPVGRGTSGHDVATVRDFLASTGRPTTPHDVPDRYDAELAAAIADFNRGRGASNPDSTFPLDAVVWAPDEFTIADVTIELGAVDIPAGATVVSGSAPITSIRLRTGGIEPDATSGHVFLAGDLRIGLDDLTPDRWGDELLARADPDGSGKLLVDGSIALAEPRTARTVPVTSVLDTGTGQCVIVAAPAPESQVVADWSDIEPLLKGVQVVVTGGDIGRSFIEGELPAESVVVANPRPEDEALCH